MMEEQSLEFTFLRSFLIYIRPFSLLHKPAVPSLRTPVLLRVRRKFGHIVRGSSVKQTLNGSEVDLSRYLSLENLGCDVIVFSMLAAKRGMKFAVLSHYIPNDFRGGVRLYCSRLVMKLRDSVASLHVELNRSVWFCNSNHTLINAE